MTSLASRIRIENELLGRLEKKYSEEEQANHLVSLLMDNFPLSSAAILRLPPGGAGVAVFAHRGLSGRFIKEMYMRPLLPVVEAALREEVAVSGDDPRAKEPSFRLEHGFGSLFAMPCRFQGETLGAFVADSEAPDLFTAETREAFRAYARLATLFLAVHSLKLKIPRVPDIDEVTGLYTFKYFHEVLYREMMRGRKFSHPVSLVFIKMRHLREMNGVYGHVAADKALAEVAGRVKAAFREVDYIARSGGTFYVVMPQVPKEEAARFAGKVVAGMDAAPVGAGEVFLELAIGVASYPADGETERVLIPQAESMVHESMRKGGSAVSVHGD